MEFVVNSASILYLITASIALFTALVAWQRRHMRGGLWLALLMLATAQWTLVGAAELAAVDPNHKIFLSMVEYIGATTTPVFFLLMVIDYTQLERLRRPGVVVFLFIPAILTLLLAFTNPLHGLIWREFLPGPPDSNRLIYVHGLGFWLFFIGPAYIFIGLGTLGLVRAYFLVAAPYRQQIVILLAGALLGWIGNAIYILGYSPVPGLETGRVTLALSGVLFSWAIFRFNFLDLMPMARHTILDALPDGVVVVDTQMRVIDINLVALKVLGYKKEKIVGVELPPLWTGWPSLPNYLAKPELLEKELQLPLEPDEHYLLRITPLYGQRNALNGHLLLLRNVSRLKQAEMALQEANKFLRDEVLQLELTQTDLREQAERDALTGLFNRRFLDQALKAAFNIAKRTHRPVSVVMFDIDRFKKFNDTYGHIAGDAMLKALGEMLRKRTRASDYACRFGGEEFVVVLPGAKADFAKIRAEAWRSEFEALRLSFEGQMLRATFSAGVACYPVDAANPEELLAKADQALYRAKQAGRNCVILAETVNGGTIPPPG